MSPKERCIEFALVARSTSVDARLVIDGEAVLRFENEEAKPVRRIRSETSQKYLLESAERWVGDGVCSSVHEWLQVYIGTREKDVCKDIREIRKALMRIEAAMSGVVCARKALEALQRGA